MLLHTALPLSGELIAEGAASMMEEHCLLVPSETHA